MLSPPLIVDKSPAAPKPPFSYNLQFPRQAYPAQEILFWSLNISLIKEHHCRAAWGARIAAQTWIQKFKNEDWLSLVEPSLFFLSVLDVAIEHLRYYIRPKLRHLKKEPNHDPPNYTTFDEWEDETDYGLEDAYNAGIATLPPEFAAQVPALKTPHGFFCRCILDWCFSSRDADEGPSPDQRKYFRRVPDFTMMGKYDPFLPENLPLIGEWYLLQVNRARFLVGLPPMAIDDNVEVVQICRDPAADSDSDAGSEDSDNSESAIPQPWVTLEQMSELWERDSRGEERVLRSHLLNPRWVPKHRRDQSDSDVTETSQETAD